MTYRCTFSMLSQRPWPLTSMLLSLLLSMCLTTGSQAESPYWRDEQGKPVAETESTKSKNDFAGSVILTTDEEWQAKWNTPPETKPSFNRAGIVSYGKRIFLLV